MIPSAETPGALVVGVIPRSTAATTGIAVGDVIVAIDGERIRNAERAGVVLRSSRGPNHLVTIAKRDGSLRTVATKLSSVRASTSDFLRRATDGPPGPVERFLFAQSTDNPVIGLAVAEQLTTDLPQFAEAQALRSRRLLDVGLYEAARPGALPLAAAATIREAIERATAIDPASADIRATAARIFFELNDAGSAQTEGNRAVAADESSADAHHLLGVSLLALGRPGPALPHLHRAVALDPYSSGFYRRLAQCYQELGESTRATATLKALETLRRPSGGPSGTSESHPLIVAFAVFGAALLGVASPTAAQHLFRTTSPRRGRNSTHGSDG